MGRREEIRDKWENFASALEGAYVLMMPLDPPPAAKLAIAAIKDDIRDLYQDSVRRGQALQAIVALGDPATMTATEQRRAYADAYALAVQALLDTA